MKQILFAFAFIAICVPAHAKYTGSGQFSQNGGTPATSITGTLPLTSLPVVDTAHGGRGSSVNNMMAYGGVQNVSQAWTAGTGPNLSNGTDVLTTCRVPFYLPKYSYDFRIVAANYSLAASTNVQTGPGNAVTEKCALEYNGVVIPATWGGQTSTSIPDAGEAVSDTISMDVPAGSTVYVRCTTAVSSGQKWIKNIQGQNASYTCGNDGSDLTIGTGALANSKAGVTLHAAAGLIASTFPSTSGSVYVSGDSIASGSGDHYSYMAGSAIQYMPGFISRGLGWGTASPTISWSFAPMQGTTVAEKINQSLAPASARAMSLNEYAIVEDGTNDLGGVTNTIKANYVTYWTMLASRGIKVYQTTLLPKTTATAATRWSDTEHQTVTANEAQRVELNNWIRTTPAPLSGYIETADIVECDQSNVATRNGGYWCVPSGTTDGGTASGGSGTTLVDSTKNWTTNQWVGNIMIITSGTGNNHSFTITGNSATTLTFTGIGVTPDNTSVYSIGPYPTGDGTHPSPKVHYALSAPVAAIATTFVGH